MFIFSLIEKIDSFHRDIQPTPRNPNQATTTTSTTTDFMKHHHEEKMKEIPSPLGESSSGFDEVSISIVILLLRDKES